MRARISLKELFVAGCYVECLQRLGSPAMQRIDGFVSSSMDLGLSSRTSDHQAATKGQLGGQQVQVDDAQSILADAAEEISLHNAEKAETKHTAERKKEGVTPMGVMNLEEIESFMDAAQAFEDPEQLVQLAKRMLSAQGDPGALARQSLGKPSEQYMALQYALQKGQQEGAPSDVLEMLRESLLDLEMAHGPRIRADINTIDIAAAAGLDRQDITAFQSYYQDVVLGEATLGQTLKKLITQFAGKQFAQGLQQMTQALGRDLAAARPSTDPVRLQSLVQDLYHLEVTATVLEGCAGLSLQLQHKHGVPAFVPETLMQAMVDVSTEKWLSASRFMSLAEQCGAGAVEPQIHFLTSVKVLMRDMPVQVFVDADQRQVVFSALQDALDKAIDREDY